MTAIKGANGGGSNSQHDYGIYTNGQTKGRCYKLGVSDVQPRVISKLF